MIKTLGVAAALGLAASPALAQEKLKIGLLLTLSGPSAVLGQQARDGFQLGVKDLGGKFGGREVEVIVVDDELKPDVAVTKVKGFLERDKVDFVVGPIFSNVAVAVHKPIVDSNTFYISTNAGPSNLAGKGCSPSSSQPPTRTIRTMRFWARSRRTAATRRSTCWRRTIRPARMRSPASSGISRARSSRNPTFR